VRNGDRVHTTGEALWVSPLSYLESSSPGTAGWIDTPNQRLSVRECLDAVFPAIPYCIDLIGGPYIETHDAVVKAFRPKSAKRPKET